MNARLIILIVLAGGLAVYFAVAKSRPGKPSNEPPLPKTEGPNVSAVPLNELPLPGSEPAVPPELAIKVEVDTSKGKNRLYFNITEAHGYYVEQFRIDAWYKREGVTGADDSPTGALDFFFDQYLKANETLRLCGEVVPEELRPVGGDIGSSENWDAEVTWHGRAREKNPEKLPPITDLRRCEE